MENTKIIHFLKCLSKQELREFGKFVSSPYHNNRKDVVRFFDVIKKHYPEFDELSSKNIFEKLFPGKKFDANAIVLLSAYLYNLGRQFLAVNALKENRFFHDYYLIKSLDKHFADSLFEKEYKNTMGLLDNEKLNNEYFTKKHLLEELKILYSLRRNRQDKVYHNTISYGNYLVYSFIVNLVITYHDMIVDKNTFNYEFTGSTAVLFLQNFNFEEFVKNLKDENSEYKNYILYYYFMFMCNYSANNEYFYPKLKEYMLRDSGRLSIAEKSARFHYAIDYCLNQAKLGNTRFLGESFNLYKEGLEKKLYQTDSKDADIGLIFFRNFVIIGLSAKEYDYVENFISEHGNEIKGEMKEDTIELSRAMLFFEKKQYDKSLDCLNKISGAFSLFKLSTKHILIKIYYETNKYDSFFSLMDTYKHYLKNEKIITELIRGYHMNFLNYLGMLLKIKSTGTVEDLFILKKEIRENSNMDFRHRLWLIEKAEELEK